MTPENLQKASGTVELLKHVEATRAQIAKGSFGIDVEVKSKFGCVYELIAKDAWFRIGIAIDAELFTISHSLIKDLAEMGIATEQLTPAPLLQRP